MTEQGNRREEMRVSGEQLTAKIKELLHEGNVRRITVRDRSERTLIEIPLTAGLVGVLVIPVWAAIAAVAALVTDCTIVVEREQD